MMKDLVEILEGLRKSECIDMPDQEIPGGVDCISCLSEKDIRGRCTDRGCSVYYSDRGLKLPKWVVSRNHRER